MNKKKYKNNKILIHISIHKHFIQMSKQEISKYISQLTPMEQKVLQIAVSHLETSFSLAKSIGFQEWLIKEKMQLPLPEEPKKEDKKETTKIKIKKKLPSL